jgi:hypothetical protein
VRGIIGDEGADYGRSADYGQSREKSTRLVSSRADRHQELLQAARACGLGGSLFRPSVGKAAA